VVEVVEAVSAEHVLERAGIAIPPGATLRLTYCASSPAVTLMDSGATFWPERFWSDTPAM
jgi:hypothetical protein